MELWRVFWNAFCNAFLEVLPLSAFGHFEILKEVLVDSSDARKMILRFSCVGIFAAIAVFYRKRIASLLREKSHHGLIWVLLMGLPSAVLFCLLEGKFPTFFYRLSVVGVALLVMSLLMLNFAKLKKLAAKKATEEAKLNNTTALVSGLLASTSILPGFSRVAILIMSARLFGKKEKDATPLAILAGLPVFAAMVGKCFCYGGIDFISMHCISVLIAVFIGFVAGLLALALLRKIEKKYDALRVFGWFQLVVALVVLVFELIK